ncbi:MAG: sulfatase-like hydrolase/transferase [Opitutales bacterium]|nr:sulfatase-like hydrolase/transferase [Opitutales bacterium]
MKRPHILLITTDQQRYDGMGIHGNPVLETPNLDHLARCGRDFSRAYVTCPVCIPARRTLLSGQHPFTHGLRRYEDGLDWDPPFTLPGILSDAGYQTQLVGKLHMHPMGKRYGYDHMVLSETTHARPTSSTQRRNDYARWLREQGVAEHPHFHGINGNGRLVAPWPLEDRFHQNNWLAREATRFLCEDRDPTSPFFLHLSFFHPHPPLVPTRDYLARYMAKEMPPSVLGEWAAQGGVATGLAADSAVGPFEEAIIQRARAAYYALINHIDDCIAHVLDRWREYGNPRTREPLYVLFSSDHGEMLGDHHLFRKSLAYEGSSHVPFFIGGYNVPIERGVDETLCSWEDVLPTVAELAGVSLPGPVDGRSLAPALRGEAVEPRESITGMCQCHATNYWQVRGDEKYIWFSQTQEEQLFDLRTDPQETRDLSADESRLVPFRESMTEAARLHGGFAYEPDNLTPCRNRPPKALFG